MNRLADSEKQMYDVMGAIANGNVPIVYKGAMITKLILSENRFEDFARETQDIDASWAGANPPTMARLTDMLNLALSGLGLNAVVKREYGEKMSAGFKIVDAGGDIKMSVDIDMREAMDIRVYQYGNMTFQGVAPDNVISDKISAVSSNYVFRRAKDLVDIYALAHCVTVKSADIQGIWKRENRIIGDFDAFRNRKEDLRHAYERLNRVNAKPEFSTLYGYLERFLTPFIEDKTPELTWDSVKGAWNDGTSRNLSKSEPKTLLGELTEAKVIADATPKKEPPKSRERE